MTTVERVAELLDGKAAWTYMDKSAWARGAWDDEPDHVLWTCCGLPCSVQRGTTAGALSGYVGVPPGHPYWDRSMSAVEDTIAVHGGVTYSGPPAASESVEFLCCLAAAGLPLEYAHYHYYGFDCAHSSDLAPALQHLLGTAFTDVFFVAYRDLAYVIREVERMAAQLELTQTD